MVPPSEGGAARFKENDIKGEVLKITTKKVGISHNTLQKV